MRAVEFTVELTGDPVVAVPEDIATTLPKTGTARVIILTADQADDTHWQRAAYEEFLRDDAPEDAVYDSYK